MKTFISALFALSLVASAQAATFTVRQTNTKENTDGNYMADSLNPSARMDYEIVPATDQVERYLGLKKCPNSTLRITGSVLSRSIEIDHENHGEAFETVKVLVRSVSGCVTGN